MMRWLFILIWGVVLLVGSPATPTWAATTPDLVVRVTDFAARPLAGVTVIVRDGAQEIVGVTDAQGRAEVVGVTGEQVRVELRGVLQGVPLMHSGDDAHGIRITRTAGTVAVELVVDGASGEVFPAASMFALEPVYLPDDPTIPTDVPGVLVVLPTAEAAVPLLQFPEEPTLADTFWDATMDVPRPQPHGKEASEGMFWMDVVRGGAALIIVGLLIGLVLLHEWRRG